MLHLHYFTNSSDWWLAEYDPRHRRSVRLRLLGDPSGAEWGTFHLDELERLNLRDGLVIVERDLHWSPTPAANANLPGLHLADQAAPPTKHPTPGVRLITHADPLVAAVQHLCPAVKSLRRSELPGLDTLAAAEGLLLLDAAEGTTPRRVMLGHDLDNATVWGRALCLRADHVIFLPDGQDWLIHHLREHLSGSDH